jgi:hypothetical protein
VLIPRPTLQGLWLSILLLLGAARIIFPIIMAEGFAAVFLPRLATKPTRAIQRVSGVSKMAKP